VEIDGSLKRKMASRRSGGSALISLDASEIFSDDGCVTFATSQIDTGDDYGIIVSTG